MSIKVELYDTDGKYLGEPETVVATSRLGFGAATFEPYFPEVDRLIIVDEQGTRLGVYRTMTRAEYDDWERSYR